MNPVPKHSQALPPAFVLRGDAYYRFKLRVHARDEWACRRCSRRVGLDLHHHPFKRSKVRVDKSWNVLSLCRYCHDLAESGELVIVGEDCNGLIVFRMRGSDADAAS